MLSSQGGSSNQPSSLCPAWSLNSWIWSRKFFDWLINFWRILERANGKSFKDTLKNKADDFAEAVTGVLMIIAKGLSEMPQPPLGVCPMITPIDAHKEKYDDDYDYDYVESDGDDDHMLYDEYVEDVYDEYIDYNEYMDVLIDFYYNTWRTRRQRQIFRKMEKERDRERDRKRRKRRNHRYYHWWFNYGYYACY